MVSDVLSWCCRHTGVRARGAHRQQEGEGTVDSSQVISQKLQTLCTGLRTSVKMQHLAEAEFELGATLYVHCRDITSKAFGDEHAISFGRMTRSLIDLFGGSDAKGLRVLSKAQSIQALKVCALRFVALSLHCA